MANELIRFEEPNTTIVFCGMCGTHLALARNIVGREYPDIEPDPHAQMFDMVNIVLSDRSYRVYDQMRALVSCRHCSIYLGYKTVYNIVPDKRSVTGEYIIRTSEVLLRNGNDVMDFDTQVPILGDWWPLIHKFNLQDHGNFFRCRSCETHLARENDVIERGLRAVGEHSMEPAYIFLFRDMVNIHLGSMVILGHDHRENNDTIAFVYCSVCYKELGPLNVCDDPEKEFIMLDMKNIVLIGPASRDSSIHALIRILEAYGPPNA